MMNERIRELAEQIYGSAHHDDFKFAELIVAECLGFVDPGSWSDDEWDQALIVARENIKKHFGVAE